jgi:hypothetical protein
MGELVNGSALSVVADDVGAPGVAVDKGADFQGAGEITA